MSEWGTMRHKYIIIEKIVIIGGLCCFCLGILFDLLVRKDIILHLVEDLNGYSSTLLQIQATLSTLTIAIIALISGNVSNSYMGVPVCGYYLTIRPWILKQKRVVFISLFLVILNTILHLWKYYNTVLFIFISAFLLLFISVIEIYSIFDGKNSLHKEIEQYYQHVINGSYNYKTKVEIVRNFIYEWKNNIHEQSETEFKKYQEFFKNGIIAIMDYNNNQSIKDINSVCFEIINSLLNEEKEIEKSRGIILLQDIYEMIWMMIVNKHIDRIDYSERITLFSQVNFDLLNSIDILPSEKVEKILDVDLITECVQRINFWIGYNKEKSKIEFDEINYFARRMGYYLMKQKKRGNLVNDKIWAAPLQRWLFFTSFNIPENCCEEYEKNRCLLLFNLCQGYILFGMTDIVKESIYFNYLPNTYDIESKMQALSILIIHCYMYYLAEREDDSCIDIDVRENVKGVFEDNKVNDSFKHFLGLLSAHRDWVDENLRNDMIEILRKYELFPRYSNSKLMIMDDVVKDFYLFIVLYIANELYLPDLINNALSTESYINYAFDGCEELAKERIGELYGIITHIDDAKKKQSKIDSMYTIFEIEIKKKYKSYLIQRAEKAQKKYKQEINVDEICELIKNNVAKEFKKKFQSILVDSDNENPIIKINVLQLYDYTERIGKDLYQSVYSNMFGNFMLNLEHYLYNQHVLNECNRFDEFNNDRAFMNFLENNDFKLLMGSRYILSNRDYKMLQEFDNLMEKYDCIYTNLMNDGLALKNDSVKICLHDVKVTIHSPNIDEAKVRYDEVTGHYFYSAVNNMPIEFEKQEIKRFLHDERKIINIMLFISIQINGENIGTIIHNKR
jgi:hypothetical protein